MKVRLRRVILNPLALLSIMTLDTTWRVSEGVPKKAVLQGFTIDPSTQNLVLFITDDSFDEVDVANDVAPLLTLEIRKIQ